MEAFQPATQYNVNHIPDLTGKWSSSLADTCVVKETANVVLLTRNVKVYIASRSPSKPKQAVTELYDETNKEALFIALDPAGSWVVKRAAREFQEDVQKRR